ncbi:hypothetical protein D8674_017262 [Pyrus ussuriensis x Pyrus communis]|uniref:S2-RNase n=1 Tax=Pyrus ussuriensis x Pyrus communis TaxID=2448454 RepID=A0A5N5HHM7_9ROSA|nr:hypothetical protein D8674_017262 [Pyrus ussuriensis x Pyrus communis]
MPTANWFTPNPYTTEAGISASKWSNFKRGFPLLKDEMANGIYELIMMSKTTIPIDGDFFTCKSRDKTLKILARNTWMNTYDFRVGFMTPTILDMAHVFGLRPSYKCVDITRDKSSSSRPAAEGSNAFQSITSLEYNPTTFKSYETSFIGFIPFAKKMFSLPSPIADPAQEHMKRLQKQLGKKQALAMFLRIRKLGPKQIPGFLIAQGLLLWNLPTLSPSKKLGPSPQEMLASKEGQQSDKEVIAKILEKLKASKVEETFQIEPSSLLTQPVHLFPFWAEPSESSWPAVSRPRKNVVVKSSLSIFVDAAFDSAGVMPHPLASLSATASLLELVKEFRQIRTKLRSSSLKTLQDAERALTDLYQTQQMTKEQYVSFISFFENLKTLRDQHLKKNHSRTSTTLHQLVEEGSTMKDRIMVVAAEIQKLE